VRCVFSVVRCVWFLWGMWWCVLCLLDVCSVSCHVFVCGVVDVSAFLAFTVRCVCVCLSASVSVSVSLSVCVWRLAGLRGRCGCMRAFKEVKSPRIEGTEGRACLSCTLARTEHARSLKTHTRNVAKHARYLTQHTRYLAKHTRNLQ